MNMKELLSTIEGLSADQQTATLETMKKNKVFTASEENLDVRYGKLKTDRDITRKNCRQKGNSNHDHEGTVINY